MEQLKVYKAPQKVWPHFISVSDSPIHNKLPHIYVLKDWEINSYLNDKTILISIAIPEKTLNKRNLNCKNKT